MLCTKREELTGECEELHEKLHDLYPASIVIAVIRLSSIRWTAHVARMGQRRSVYRICVAKLDGWRPFENLGVDGDTEEDMNDIRYERVDWNDVVQHTDK
jgi:hypothetical protein